MKTGNERARVPELPMSLVRRFVIPLTLLALSGAYAQLSYPPQRFAERFQAPLQGGTLRLKGATVELRTLGGLVYRARYDGGPEDTLTAARVLSFAVGRPDALGDVVEYLETRSGDLRGKGPVPADVGGSYRFVLEWGRRLRFTLELRAYRDFGADRHVLGRSGPLIREFSDFECPYCLRYARQVLPEIKRRMVEAGRARFSYRHLPLTSIHPQALPLAVAAECAARQRRFFEFHDAVFAGHTDPAALAGRLRLDAGRFTACREDPAARAAVDADAEVARRLGVDGTPTVFVGPFRLPDAFDLGSYERYTRMAEAYTARSP